MNPSFSLKRRPKPVLNGKVKRLKTRDIDKNSVAGSVDKIKSSVTDNYNESVRPVLPSVPEKTNLFQKTLQSFDSTRIIATAANHSGNNQKSVDQVNDINSLLGGNNRESYTDGDGPSVSNCGSPISLLVKNSLNIGKNSKIQKQTDGGNKFKKGKKSKPISISKVINNDIVIRFISDDDQEGAKKINCINSSSLGGVNGETNAARNEPGVLNNDSTVSLAIKNSINNDKKKLICTNVQGRLYSKNWKCDQKSNISPVNNYYCSSLNIQENNSVSAQENSNLCDSIYSTGSSRMPNCEKSISSDGKLNESNITLTQSNESVNSISTSTACKETQLLDSSVKSNSPEKNKNSFVKSFIRKNKQDLKDLKLKAYDEDGIMNKKNMTLRDFIYFNPPHNPMALNDDNYREESDDSCDSSEEDVDTDFAVPQVRVGADGNIIIDTKSLFIRHSKTEKKIVNLKKSKLIKENEYSSNRLKKKKRRKRNQDTMSSLLGLKEKRTVRKMWTPEETLKFYKVLNEFGSDFMVMMDAFPDRTRTQLKRKFQSEEKIRCKYIDLAMMKRDSIDFDALEEELKKKPVEKDGIREERERVIQEKKESERLVEMEYARLKKSRKRLSCFDAMGVRRVGRVYDEKVKRMRMYIKRMKLMYVKETGKDNKVKKKPLKKKRKVVVSEDSDDEASYFDLTIPLYEKMFYPKQEEIFIQEIKSEDDLDLFIGLCSEMYRTLGNDWRDWVKRKVVDQLLKSKEERSGKKSAKEAAANMKIVIEEKDKRDKLESCYQLFSDPFDFIDPLANDKSN